MYEEVTPPSGRPRDGRGHFVQILCTDPNCDGSLRWDQHRLGYWHWACDGLTHFRDDGELFACERSIDE